jgi:hypothetical protein
MSKRKPESINLQETIAPVRSSEIVRRAAARTLLRLKRETVLRPIGPICMEEWKCCRDIIAEEMTKLLPNDKLRERER